jgi:ubiquinone/menaquinone biosynthesis C-methylase UbiE
MHKIPACVFDARGWDINGSGHKGMASVIQMTNDQPNSAPEPIETLPTRDGYDRWAAVYDDDGNPLVALEEPLVDELLGDVNGLHIADIGCGTGRHSVRLASRGARVSGFDFSEEMLRRARAKAAGLNVEFHQHDLAEPLPVPDQSFDRVICGLVIDHIADLPGLFREMHRVCRPDGFAVVSVMHPAMMLRGVQARFHDAASGREVRPASCTHQISDYVMAAVGAGWTLDHLSEHATDEALAAKFPRAHRYIGWPMLLMMRLTPAR